MIYEHKKTQIILIVNYIDLKILSIYIIVASREYALSTCFQSFCISMMNERGCARVYFNKLKQVFFVTFHSDGFDLCFDHVIFCPFSTKKIVFQLLHSNVNIGGITVY